VEYEGEDEGVPVTYTVELARFAGANAGVLGALISNLQQNVSLNAAGTAADISWSFDVTAEEGEPPQRVSLNIEDAALSGAPLSSFGSDTVSGGTPDVPFGPPADGQRADCPDPAEEDIISQEEFEFELDLDLCGTGTATMMPLLFLALGWLKWRR
jgi:uncharacterized protein (TIGR03382 family)